jgi:hypothetical protein
MNTSKTHIEITTGINSVIHVVDTIEVCNYLDELFSQGYDILTAKLIKIN